MVTQFNMVSVELFDYTGVTTFLESPSNLADVGLEVLGKIKV